MHRNRLFRTRVNLRRRDQQWFHTGRYEQEHAGVKELLTCPTSTDLELQHLKRIFPKDD